MSNGAELWAYSQKIWVSAGTIVLMTLIVSLTTCEVRQQEADVRIAEIEAQEAEMLRAKGHTTREIQCFQADQYEYARFECDR